MRPRTEPRPAPARAFVVPVPGREDHVFAALRDDRLASLLAIAGKAGSREEGAGVGADPNLAAMAGVLGILWAHPSMDLEDPPPGLGSLTVDFLVAYGDRVLDELDAAGYVVTVDVVAMFLTIAQQVNERSAGRYKAFDEEKIREQVAFFLRVARPVGTSG